MIPVDDINFTTQIINTSCAWRMFNEIVLMQYTGLKDMTGVEIYEGDILRVALITGKTNLCEVVYNLLHARFEYVVLDMPVISYSVSEVEEVVVIGNIHENKELLK